MFHAKIMTPRRPSKQTAAAASKIKNKLLNTSSSFYKVSLKNNNKALALALEEQKERRRQLEKDIVVLQKQVEALCFELASTKYKHRKLLLILKNLHSNTLQHLDMVADLFTDSDLPKLSKETDKASEALAPRRPTDQLPPEPDVPEASLFPFDKKPVLLPEENPCLNVLDIQSGPQLDLDVFKDKTSSGRRHSSQHRPAPKVEMCRPSSGLREEMERLSGKNSQSGLDVKSKLCPQNSLTPSPVSVHDNSKQPPPDSLPLPSVSVVEPGPETSSKQEKTLILNTTMEMTLTHPTEIVAVETKAKKPVPSGKPKARKKKEQAPGSKVAENPQPQSSRDSSSEAQNSPFSAMLQTDDPAAKGITDTETTAPWSSKTQDKSLTTSRIPKPSKSGAGSHQKKAKKTLKSKDTAQSKTDCGDTVSSPDLDDCFTDPNVKFPGVRKSRRSPPDEDTVEEALPNITCKRSRTKSRRISKCNTFFTLPTCESGVRHSGSDQIQNTVEEAMQDKYEAFKEQGLPELLFCAPADSEHVADTVQRKEDEPISAGSHKPRCRGTFFISVARESTTWSRASSGVGVNELDSVPPAGSSTCEAEEAIVMQDLESRPHKQSNGDQAQKTPNSGKRPWLATQDPGSPRRDSCSNDNQETDHPEQGCTLESEFQKAKKARREESKSAAKKKKAQREECVENLNKRKQKIKSSNKGSRPEDDACYLADKNDTSTFSGVGSETHEEQHDDLQIASMNSDMMDDIPECFFAMRPEKSKFKMDSLQNQKRRTSKLHTVTNRNLRETFVVYRRKTRDTVSHHSLRTSDVSDSFDHTVDNSEATAHQTLGDLLTDEMPPWLAVDISTADTEVGSILATPRRETLSRVAAIEESSAVTAEASPAGRVLTTVTNTISTPDAAAGGRTRRRHGVVSYKEPSINSKMRRGDKFTDSQFLRSPVHKDGKKKKKQKKTETVTKLSQSIFVD